MKRHFYIMLIWIAFLVGCNGINVYKKYKDLSTRVSWKRSKTIEFHPEIKNTDARYDIFFELNYHTSYPCRTSKFIVQIIDPSGELISKKRHEIKVRDRVGKNLGKGAGDYWDIREKLYPGFKFNEEGKYKFIVNHDMEEDVYTHVYRLGMIIKKSRE